MCLTRLLAYLLLQWRWRYDYLDKITALETHNHLTSGLPSFCLLSLLHRVLILLHVLVLTSILLTICVLFRSFSEIESLYSSFIFFRHHLSYIVWGSV